MTNQGLRLAALVMATCLPSAPTAAEPASQTPRTDDTNATTVPQQEHCVASTSDAAGACDNLFGMMMEYQKTLNKEQREDKKIGREDEQRALGAKAAKLKTDNQSIDLQMKESWERAETVQQDGQTRVAIPPVAGVVRAKPPAATETTAEACRLSEAICPEPCKLPPCP